MSIRRRNLGRTVVGLALDSEGQAPDKDSLRGEWRSPVVKRLMESLPWDGFLSDRQGWLPGGSSKGVDRVDVFTENKRDYDGLLVYSPAGDKGPAKGVTPREGGGAGSAEAEGWMQQLTKEEAKDTEQFLSEYPEIERMLKEKATCTDEELVSVLGWIVPADPGLVEGIDQCYRAFEKSHIRSPLDLPLSLVHSTTMSDIEYPLAAQLESSVLRLRDLPLYYKGIVQLLNKVCATIVNACYKLFRLFRRGDSTYYLRRNPVRQPFPTLYTSQEGYPRLIPKGPHGASSIANLKRDCRRVALRAINKIALPERLHIEEIDMVACHTGIYAGLMGEERAPQTWAAYHSPSFWEHVMSQWGDGLPKLSSPPSEKIA